MKKYLLLIFTMFFLVALTSCDINKYEENTWYSNDRLKECLVEDLPEIKNVEYVKKNDEDVYFYMNSNDYNSYVNIVYNYLKSQNFEYLGTKGDDKASLAGMLSTYYFKEANTLEEFRTDGDGSDYTFVYSDGTLDGSRIVFNIIKFYRDDNSTLEYKNKEFNYNTFMVVRHYSESPLGGIPMLKDEEIEEEIIDAYVEKYELLETPIIGQLFNSFTKDGKEVVPFIMGEYGDAMVWSETVANIYFYYPDHRRIEVYYDNEIYTLQEAYDQGILTQQNLIDIAKEDDYDCKMGHSWDEGEVTQVPGGGEVMLYTCLVCGERKTYYIHNDIGYACDVTITGEIDSLIENVSGLYTAGTTLEIYSHPLMDADLAMYVNGEFHQIQDTIKVDGEYRWRYSLVLPAEDIVIEFKTVGIEYSDVQTILNIPNLSLEDIVEVRYERGYIGVAPGSLTDIAYSTDMEDKNMLLSLLEMTVYEDVTNNWQITGGGYTIYSIFTNDQRYDIEITNGYISINQKHYKFLGEYVSFEYPSSQAHSFITYLDNATVYRLDEIYSDLVHAEQICEIDNISSLEFVEFDWTSDNLATHEIVTEFDSLYVYDSDVFYYDGKHYKITNDNFSFYEMFK